MRDVIEIIDYPTVRYTLAPVAMWSAVLWVFSFAASAYFAVVRWQKSPVFLVGAAAVLAVAMSLPFLLALPLGPRDRFPMAFLLLWLPPLTGEAVWIWVRNRSHRMNQHRAEQSL